jgi:hypothetical protein
MDNGCFKSPGAKLNTVGLTHSDCKFLAELLMELYGLKVSINKSSVKDPHYLYIWKESLPIFDKIVRPHILPSMLHKLGDPC